MGILVLEFAGALFANHVEMSILQLGMCLYNIHNLIAQFSAAPCAFIDGARRVWHMRYIAQ
jgi:hypothetical protein